MFNKKNTTFFVTALTLWRGYLCATMQLHHDESYYWLWSKHLALSYFDHPPMVSYFVWLTTLFSNAELNVRLSGLVVSVLLSILVWKLAIKMFDSEEVASGSVVLLNIMPVTMTGGVLITPDTPAFLFWGLSLYLTWMAFEKQKPLFWYLTGVSFGLAMMSKYTTVLFGMCVLLYMIFTEDRKWFKSISPYLASLIALAVFLPVVYWNYKNNWVSFKFQLNHGIGKKAYSLSYLGEYLGGQLLVASPFVWLAGMWASVVFLFSKNRAKLFLVMTSLPILVFFCWASLKKPGEANWPALAYFSFVLITSAYFLDGSKLKRIIFFGLILTSFSMSFLATLHARFSVLPLAKWNKDWAEADATNFLYGWKELAAAIEKTPDVKFVITRSHQMSSEITYYTQGRVYAFVDPNHTRFSQYNLWKIPEDIYGTDGLYVFFEDLSMPEITAEFESIDSIGHMKVFRKGFPIRNYRIIHGKSLKRFG
jgi:undecaprenyl-diphosphatase